MSLCADWCRHYNGLVKDVCEVGVRYSDLVPDVRQQANGLPCFWSNRKKENLPTCERREWPSRGELQEREEWIQEYIGYVVPLIGQIKKQHGRKNASGELECPRCRNQLRYTVAAYNGHTSGKCPTVDCLSWME